MRKYLKPYLPCMILAALLMAGEVSVDLLQPKLMSRVVDEGVLGLAGSGAGSLALIGRLGLRMILLVLFGGLCGSLNNVFTHIAAQNTGNGIRKDAFARIMRFSFPQLDRFGTGSLVTRVTNDITQVQDFVSLFMRGLIRTSFLTFGSMVCMLQLDRDLGLIVLCAFPFLVGCIGFCLWRATPLFSALQAHLDQINRILQEDISGIRIIKACVREGYERLRFGKANERLTGVQLRVLVIFACMDPTVNALMYLVVAMVLWAGAAGIPFGRTTPGAIMAAITYTTQLLNGILMLSMLSQNISRGLASWKRLREVLESEPELRDGSVDAADPIQNAIEFRGVSFAYPGTGRPVLNKIDLTICRGETVAIMGATGCGKSTLVQLIPRFYDVTEGQLLVDGVDVREYRQQALRKKIAVALQRAELFSASIAENIAWGRPDAAEEEVREASRIAQADEFVCRTPDGYDTLVAERGMGLSGGQRQRLSAARAIAAGADILIFDDATSALDLKTEAQLYAALDRVRPGTTKLIVAQRIASARRAGRIIMLENGRIAAVGSHEELLAGCRAYQDIYHSQMGEEEAALG